MSISNLETVDENRKRVEFLKAEGRHVVQLAESLRQRINRDIDDYKLDNGSIINTRTINKLPDSTRRRLFKRLNGEWYERATTHVQFKVVWDEGIGALGLIESTISDSQHVCLLLSNRNTN